MEDFIEKKLFQKHYLYNDGSLIKNDDFEQGKYNSGHIYGSYVLIDNGNDFYKRVMAVGIVRGYLVYRSDRGLDSYTEKFYLDRRSLLKKILHYFIRFLHE